MKTTIEEYFVYEDKIDFVAEYYDGKIVDRFWENETHNHISMNLIASVGNQLKEERSCRMHNAFFRVAIVEAKTFVRPDFWVICGPTDFYQGRNDTATNPIFIAEVQSESTAKFDRTTKFEKYRMIPTLREYVLIEQKNPQVDIFFKNEKGTWEFLSVTDLGAEVRFNSLNISIPMKDIYKNVVFEKL